MRPAPLDPTSDCHQVLGNLASVAETVSELLENCMLAKNLTPRQPVPPVEVSIVGVKVCPEPAYVGVNTPPVPSAHPIVGGL